MRRQLPVIKWVADHPRAMAVCGITGVAPESEISLNSSGYSDSWGGGGGNERRDSISSLASFGSDLSVAGVDGAQPPAPQPLGKAAKRAGIFAAVEAEESMEAQRLDDRQAQYAELREAEKELLDACRLARDVSGGAVGPSRSTELELMLADVGRELRRLEDLGVRPLAW